MKCNTYPRNTLGAYKYVVILSRYEGKLMLSRHKQRTTWETQGGHIEVGFFDELPENLTYPDITPVLLHRAVNEHLKIQ